MQDQFAIINVQQLQTLIENNNTNLVKIIIEQLQSQQQQEKDRKPVYLTRKETAKVLNITLPTLQKYTTSGKLIAHHIGRRVLYNQSELESSLDTFNTVIRRKKSA